ncbi:hypothetical protein GCM10020220_091420 [Nonomuraea rubra]|uniref:hypothetical protein n=1 Tax=Nonomuraea rubra TaxID=46180 RepID=UPI0031F1B5AC
MRSIAASIEASRLRAEAGYTAERPTRHFVFVGQPRHRQTSVARALAKIFLRVRPAGDAVTWWRRSGPT